MGAAEAPRAPVTSVSTTATGFYVAGYQTPSVFTALQQGSITFS